jgi:tetratricopeptide (TPR) repeat protein
MSRLMLPMRGAALGYLASALRLSGKTVSVEPTRKRLFADSAEVSESKLDEAVRDLVDRLFAPKYLGARGFEPDEILSHNALVSRAVLAALDRWNAAASLFNLAPPDVRLPLPEHLLTLGVERDVILRVAAYDVLFGRRHPVREAFAFLLRRGAVREWWRAFERCMPEAPSLGALERRTRLHRETLKKLRKGDLKTAGVLGQVAEGLGQLGVRDHADRLLDAARIEFDLRVAVGLDELERTARKHPSVVELRSAGLWQVIRHALSQMDRAEVEDILSRGSLSNVTEQLQPAMEGWCLAQIVALMEPERTFVAGVEALQRAGRHEEAGRLYAARTRAMAEELRRAAPDAELVKPMADFLEWDATYFEALSRLEPVLPAPPANLEAEMKASALLLNRVSPWSKPITSEEDALREAVTVAPHLCEPRRSLARHLAMQGCHEEALAGARELVTMFPDELPIFEELIEHLGDAERWEELLETLAGDPRTSVPLQASRGAALVMLDRLDEAEPVLDAALRDDPRNQTAMRAKAKLLRKSRRASEAGVLERRADHLLAGGLDRAVASLAEKDR